MGTTRVGRTAFVTTRVTSTVTGWGCITMRVTSTVTTCVCGLAQAERMPPRHRRRASAVLARMVASGFDDRKNDLKIIIALFLLEAQPLCEEKKPQKKL
jgi:hypothetical protein